MEEFGNTVRRVVKVLKSCACLWEFNKFRGAPREDLYPCDLSGRFLESIGCVRPLLARYIERRDVSASHKSRDKFTARPSYMHTYKFA